MKNITCPICNQNAAFKVISIKNQPLSNLALADNFEEALKKPSFDIEIVNCHLCGHTYNKNASLENTDYNQDSNFTYYVGEVWKQYTIKLANKFRRNFNIENKNILEVGSGDGTFLLALSEKNNTCTGYEPSQKANNPKDNVRIVPKFFDPERHLQIDYDVIILRHIIEHFEKPKEFLTTIIMNLIKKNQNPLFFIEVPNLEPTIYHKRINDFIYEHISYFSFYSLRYLLSICNLNVIELTGAYNNENIIAICSISEEFIKNRKQTLAAVESLNKNIDVLLSDYSSLTKSNDLICIWGAGGKGAAFLNIIKSTLTGKEIIVDSDDRKVGKYVPLVSLEIQSISSIKNYTFDIIIITTWLGKKNIMDEIKINKIQLKELYVFSEQGLTKSSLS